MTAQGYVFDQGWTLERSRLAGLEAALDAGTRHHLTEAELEEALAPLTDPRSAVLCR
jgi:hypothetical protein